MKIELIQETNPNNEVIYFTQVDDLYLSGTLATSLDKADKIYQQVIANNGKVVNKQILKSTIIENENK